MRGAIARLTSLAVRVEWRQGKRERIQAILRVGQMDNDRTQAASWGDELYG